MISLESMSGKSNRLYEEPVLTRESTTATETSQSYCCILPGMSGLIAEVLFGVNPDLCNQNYRK
uniref:Uncharacterized protein n=1 Tax=Arundo donax TaxID=35708 RepID=A0A0A9GGL4_ARUDO